MSALQLGRFDLICVAILYNSDGSPYQQVTAWDEGSTTYTLI